VNDYMMLDYVGEMVGLTFDIQHINVFLTIPEIKISQALMLRTGLYSIR